MSYSEEILKKQKYYEKLLSKDAVGVMYLRMLDVESLFSRYVWLNLSPFDLSQLGIGLLYDLALTEFKPLMLGFQFSMPSIEEMLQGIWANFTDIDWEELYTWMLDLDLTIEANFEEAFKPKTLKKGKYDISRYERSYYDPVLQQEFITRTIHRLRLNKKIDWAWYKTTELTGDLLEVSDATDIGVSNRIMLHFSAQTSSFMLGLSVLGHSWLTQTEGDLAVIPFRDIRGEEHTVKFRTLDHLQMGMILGLTPLGFGLLLPTHSIYKLPEGYKNPPIISMITDKLGRISKSAPLTTWAYGNYNKPEEMTNFHKSERASQYDAFQHHRRFIQQWVTNMLTHEVTSPVLLQQYINAVLQIYAWRAKRHKWGYNLWKDMDEEQFRTWWIQYWENLGLNSSLLTLLYEGSKTWMNRLIRTKASLGEKVSWTRRFQAKYR